MSTESSSGPESSALSELLDLSMPANSEAIATVVDTISETLTQLEVPEQKRFEVALAVQVPWPMQLYTDVVTTHRNKFGAG